MVIPQVKIFDNFDNYDVVIDYPDGILFEIDKDLKDEYNSFHATKLQKLALRVLNDKYPQLPRDKKILAVFLAPEYRRLITTYTKERMFVVLGIIDNGLQLIKDDYYYDMPVAKVITEQEEKGKWRLLGIKNNDLFELRSKKYHHDIEKLSLSTLDIWQIQKDNGPLLHFKEPVDFALWVDVKVTELQKKYTKIVDGSRHYMRGIDFRKSEFLLRNRINRSKYKDVIWLMIHNKPYKDFCWDMVKPTKIEYFQPTLQKERDGLRA